MFRVRWVVRGGGGLGVAFHLSAPRHCASHTLRAMHPLMTPDGRYFIGRGRLWRATNPNLAEKVRQRLVNELMDARRAVKAAKAFGDPDALAAALQAVDNAKKGLGERGPVWWTDGEPDWNRYLLKTPPMPSDSASLQKAMCRQLNC